MCTLDEHKIKPFSLPEFTWRRWRRIGFINRYLYKLQSLLLLLLLSPSSLALHALLGMMPSPRLALLGLFAKYIGYRKKKSCYNFFMDYSSVEGISFLMPFDAISSSLLGYNTYCVLFKHSPNNKILLLYIAQQHVLSRCTLYLKFLLDNSSTRSCLDVSVLCATARRQDPGRR